MTVVIKSLISTFDNANPVKSRKRSAQARIIRVFIIIIKTYAKGGRKKQRQVGSLDAVF
jgi:protein involved in ribonucleotide reduction